jgi:hypothetical protein
METVKSILSVIPVPVWVILALLLLVGFWWFSDDVGAWWSDRQSAAFDKKMEEKQAEIDKLAKERDALIERAVQAEAREQSKIIEADLLRQEAASHGVNIQKAQERIDAALSEYANDQSNIDKLKTGEITAFQLCATQCRDSADLGYPCLPSVAQYCSKFKKE